MLTLEKQLQLEGRLVRILVTVLLFSWLAGLFALDALRQQLNTAEQAQLKTRVVEYQMQQALWVIADERLAIKTCYHNRMGYWRENVRHVSE